MIVTCSSCQTRFRIGDDRIGPQGARVRCSRCKAVFVVRRVEPDTAPAPWTAAAAPAPGTPPPPGAPANGAPPAE
ncbi:MAG TPA: zinc-ribbon domain-containing protein, partial [Anaeromyxobacteraceae bacterium]